LCTKIQKVRIKKNKKKLRERRFKKIKNSLISFLYLHQWALAFVSASFRVLHSFASSNLDTFACAIGVRVLLIRNILLAPPDPMRATVCVFWGVFIIFSDSFLEFCGCFVGFWCI